MLSDFRLEKKDRREQVATPDGYRSTRSIDATDRQPKDHFHESRAYLPPADTSWS